MKETKEELDKEEIATKTLKDSISIDDEKMQSGEIFQDLSQYECDQCKENHYHTKITVNIQNYWVNTLIAFFFKPLVIDHEGYQFDDPCPPSMRGVNIQLCLCVIIKCLHTTSKIHNI